MNQRSRQCWFLDATGKRLPATITGDILRFDAPHPELDGASGSLLDNSGTKEGVTLAEPTDELGLSFEVTWHRQ